MADKGNASPRSSASGPANATPQESRGADPEQSRQPEDVAYRNGSIQESRSVDKSEPEKSAAPPSSPSRG